MIDYTTCEDRTPSGVMATHVDNSPDELRRLDGFRGTRQPLPG